MTPDEHDLYRDDLAEQRRERDRQREARGRWRRPAPDLTARHAFQARQVELVHAALDASITALECPACLAPVFAPGDSAGEHLDCTGCKAQLITHQGTEGVTAILVPGGAP